jgi:hypothetical protein
LKTQDKEVLRILSNERDENYGKNLMTLLLINSYKPKIEKFWEPKENFINIYSEDSDEIACINLHNL